MKPNRRIKRFNIPREFHALLASTDFFLGPDSTPSSTSPSNTSSSPSSISATATQGQQP